MTYGRVGRTGAVEAVGQVPMRPAALLLLRVAHAQRSGPVIGEREIGLAEQRPRTRTRTVIHTLRRRTEQCEVLRAVGHTVVVEVVQPENVPQAASITAPLQLVRVLLIVGHALVVRNDAADDPGRKRDGVDWAAVMILGVGEVQAAAGENVLELVLITCSPSERERVGVGLAPLEERPAIADA